METSKKLSNSRETGIKKLSGKKRSLELRGHIFSLICTSFLLVFVISIIFMVTEKGISTFTVNHVSVMKFLTGKDWSPSQVNSMGEPEVGALSMIIGSFAVTIGSTIVALPLAIATAIFVVELSPKFGSRVMQPIMELLVGIPSVVYGILGLYAFIPFIRKYFGGSGFGILAGIMVLSIMVLPTITSLSIDSLKAVENSKREGALALGASRWQMIYGVVLKDARIGILTAVILGMSRAFGEALAVQMVIGNTTVIPTSLNTPAATLTSILTMSMGNTIPGQLENNVLWSLALLLMIMSLFFIMLIHAVGRKK